MYISLDEVWELAFTAIGQGDFATARTLMELARKETLFQASTAKGRLTAAETQGRIDLEALTRSCNAILGHISDPTTPGTMAHDVKKLARAMLQARGIPLEPLANPYSATDTSPVFDKLGGAVKAVGINSGSVVTGRCLDDLVRICKAVLANFNGRT